MFHVIKPGWKMFAYTQIPYRYYMIDKIACSILYTFSRVYNDYNVQSHHVYIYKYVFHTYSYMCGGQCV